MTDVPLLLFEPNAGGHHAGYVGHLLDAWRRWELPGRLVAAVSPELFAGRPDLAALAGPTERGAIELYLLPEAEQLRGLPLLKKGWAERGLLRAAVEARRPRRVLALYGDHTQLSLASRLRFPPETEVSLLLLRVSHHRADGVSPLTEARKRMLLWLAARSPHAGSFLTSDPAAVDALAALGANSAYVPDPVPLPDCSPNSDSVRVRYGVDAGRRLYLVYGALAERKGVLTILRALEHLPAEEAAQMSVLLAGPVQPDLADSLDEAIAHARDHTRAQVLLHDAFLYEAETCALFNAADVVLAPYLGHAGTSSVLIRAAGARRPIVSQDRGLMAEQVRAHALGQVADATRPDAIAEAMRTPARGFEAARARAFAESQTPEAYARAVFDALALRS